MYPILQRCRHCYEPHNGVQLLLNNAHRLLCRFTAIPRTLPLGSCDMPLPLLESSCLPRALYSTREAQGRGKGRKTQRRLCKETDTPTHIARERQRQRDCMRNEQKTGSYRHTSLVDAGSGFPMGKSSVIGLTFGASKQLIVSAPAAVIAYSRQDVGDTETERETERQTDE